MSKEARTEALAQAVDAVKIHKTRMSKASADFKIPYSTLHANVTRLETRPVGHPTTLPKHVEEELVNTIRFAQCSNLPLTMNRLRQLAVALQAHTSPHIQTPSLFGTKWWRRFRKSYPNLAAKPTETLDPRRAAVNRSNSVIWSFFRGYAKLFYSHLFQPHQIWNLDETGSTQSERPQNTVVDTSLGSATTVMSNKRAPHYTYLPCINAGGEMYRPLVIFAGETINLSSLKEEHSDCDFAITPSSFMCKELFIDWFKRFVKWIRQKTSEPQLIILDRLASHVCFEVLNIAEKNDIFILVFPTHSTHLLQPLDVSLFKRFKSCMRKKLDDELIKTRAESLTHGQLLTLLKVVTTSVFTPENIRNSFRLIGIVPLCPQIVFDRIKTRHKVESQTKRKVEPNVIEVNPMVQETVVDKIKRLEKTVAALSGSWLYTNQLKL